MPPLAAAAGCIKVQLIGTNQGGLWMNNLHFQTEAGAAVPQDTGQIATFLNAIATSWGANIGPLCNDEVELTALTYTDLTASDRVQFTSTLVTPEAGSRAGDPLPASIAMVMSLRVSNRFRGGHGRIYIPAGVQGDVVAGRQWSGAFNTAANTAVSAFRTTLEALTMGVVLVRLVVLSYFSGSHKTPDDRHPLPVARPTPLPMLVTSARVRTRVDTQRRRLGKETV